MKIHELNKDQLTQVKQSYWMNKLIEMRTPCYQSDLIDVDYYVSDEEILTEHETTEFYEDDFF